MKLNFTNKKDRKNCQYFISALKEIQYHNLKDSQRPVYFKVNKENIKMMTSLKDIQSNRIEDLCCITIKNDVYNVLFDEEDDYEEKIFQIKSYKILRVIKKNENKINLIELNINHLGMEFRFQTEAKAFQCLTTIQSIQIDQQWPENPQTVKQGNNQLIQLGRLTGQSLKYFNMKQQQQLWLQLEQQGLYFRTNNNDKYRKQQKIIFQQNSGFNHLTIKNKLKSKNFINIRGEYLLEHLNFCVKNKKQTQMKIKNILDRYDDQLIESSYMILKTAVQYGFILKVLGCFIGQSMKQSINDSYRRQRQGGQQNKQRQNQKQSYLLKAEENNIEMVRRIVYNRYNQYDGEAMIVQESYRERRPIGKIEQGEQTFTRKAYSRY